MRYPYLSIVILAAILGPAAYCPDGICPKSFLCQAEEESFEQRSEERAAKREMADDEDKEFDNGMQPPTEDREADLNSPEEKAEERTAKREMDDDEDKAAEKGDQKYF